MQLPNVDQIEVTNKNVLVRADLDDATEGSPRLQATQNLIAYLQEKEAARIKVIGHNGSIDQVEVLGVDLNWDLRADSREESNDPEFAKELALGFDIYINEAFAVSHRTHASVVALPQYFKSQNLPVAAGPRFIKEVEVLSRITHPNPSLTFSGLQLREGIKLLIIGGIKEDKEIMAKKLEPKFDVVLRGGKLPGVKLTADGKDIAPEVVANIKQQIANASLIVVAGPMGKFEEVPTGTQEVFTAVANSQAYKIAGGGDTEAALEKFDLTSKFDWISAGGGAMLEFLATGTLPGIQSLL